MLLISLSYKHHHFIVSVSGRIKDTEGAPLWGQYEKRVHIEYRAECSLEDITVFETGNTIEDAIKRVAARIQEEYS